MNEFKQRIIKLLVAFQDDVEDHFILEFKKEYYDVIAILRNPKTQVTVHKDRKPISESYKGHE